MNEHHGKHESACSDIGESPFVPLKDHGASPVQIPNMGSTSTTFSLRALFVFTSVCAVLAALLAMVVRTSGVATGVQMMDTPAMVISTSLALVVFAPFAGLLLYGHKRGMVLSIVIALPIGALVGAVAAMPSKAMAVQIPITLDASLALVVFTLLSVRRRTP